MEKYLHSDRAVSSVRYFYLFYKTQYCTVDITKSPFPLLYLPNLDSCFELTFHVTSNIANLLFRNSLVKTLGE